MDLNTSSAACKILYNVAASKHNDSFNCFMNVLVNKIQPDHL